LTGRCIENKLIIDFTQNLLSETGGFPYIILREYQLLGIDEKELIVLLRILHPSLICGNLTLETIAKEFSVTPDEARIIVRPFLDKRLLEEDTEMHSFTYNGIMSCIFENWMNAQRNHKKAAQGRKPLVKEPPEEDKKLIRNLSRLYHAFEQELGKNLSPIQSEEITSWLEKDKLAPELIEEALKRAVLQGKRSFSYIKSILKNWREAGYEDLASVMTNDRKPDAKISGGKKENPKKNNSKKNQYLEIYDKY